MPEITMPGPVAENAGIREAVCIHTKKIYDSCKDKDIAGYNNSFVSWYGTVLKSAPLQDLRPCKGARLLYALSRCRQAA